eukprot:3402012-Pyramimonas_sp.AAC.1
MQREKMNISGFGMLLEKMTNQNWIRRDPWGMFKGLSADNMPEMNKLSEPSYVLNDAKPEHSSLEE